MAVNHVGGVKRLATIREGKIVGCAHLSNQGGARERESSPDATGPMRKQMEGADR